MKQIIVKNIRLLTGSLVLLITTLTLSAQTLINDTSYAGATQSGTTITLASGKVYTDLIGSAGTGITVNNNNQITIGTSGNSTLYRAFDSAADNFKLKDLSVGESVKLSFSLSAVGSLNANATLNFGFISYGVGTNTNPAYVFGNIGGGGSNPTSFYYRDSNVYFSNTGNKFGSTTSGLVITDQSPHTFTFTITAKGSDKYDFSASMDTTQYLLLTDYLFTANAMNDKYITGVGFRETESGVVALNSLSVTRYLTAVPEPSTLVLLGVGAGLLAVLRRKK